MDKDKKMIEEKLDIEDLVINETDEIGDIGTKSVKNKLSKKRIIFAALLGTMLALVMSLAIALVAMRSSGKRKIYQANEDSSINFDKNNDEQEPDIEIDLDNMGQVSGIEGESESKSAASGEAETFTLTENDNSTELHVNNGNVIQQGQDGMDVEMSEERTSSAIIQAGENEEYDVIYNGEEYVYNDDIITLLVLGIDKMDKVKPAANGIDGGQSDGIYLFVMNPHTKKIDLIAVHRDTITKIWIYDKNGEYLYSGRAQICLQHGYGDGMELSNERAKEAVSNLFYGLPIHSVSSINMGAIAQLNDAVGGVTVEALETFTFGENSFTQGETVTLKGSAALAYVKWRDTSQHYTASKRLERQKQYLNRFASQALTKIKTDVGVIVDVYDIVKDYVVTDLSLDEMTYLGTESISYSFGKIYSLEGTVDTSRKYERYYLNEEAFQKLIIDVFYEKL